MQMCSFFCENLFISPHHSSSLIPKTSQRLTYQIDNLNINLPFIVCLGIWAFVIQWPIEQKVAKSSVAKPTVVVCYVTGLALAI